MALQVLSDEEVRESMCCSEALIRLGAGAADPAMEHEAQVIMDFKYERVASANPAKILAPSIDSSSPKLTSLQTKRSNLAHLGPDYFRGDR